MSQRSDFFLPKHLWHFFPFPPIRGTDCSGQGGARAVRGRRRPSSAGGWQGCGHFQKVAREMSSGFSAKTYVRGGNVRGLGNRPLTCVVWGVCLARTSTRGRRIHIGLRGGGPSRSSPPGEASCVAVATKTASTQTPTAPAPAYTTPTDASSDNSSS